MPELIELTIDQVPGLAPGFAEAMSRVTDIYAERDGYKGDVITVKVTATTEVRITQMGTVSIHGQVTVAEPKRTIRGCPAHIQGGGVFIEPEDEQIGLPFAIHNEQE